MKYTSRDLEERAEHITNGLGEAYVIDGHRIVLTPVWSYGGGRSTHLVTVVVDGNRIATRCTINLGIRKALAHISE